MKKFRNFFSDYISEKDMDEDILNSNIELLEIDKSSLSLTINLSSDKNIDDNTIYIAQENLLSLLSLNTVKINISKIATPINNTNNDLGLVEIIKNSVSEYPSLKRILENITLDVSDDEAKVFLSGGGKSLLIQKNIDRKISENISRHLKRKIKIEFIETTKPKESHKEELPKAVENYVEKKVVTNQEKKSNSSKLDSEVIEVQKIEVRKKRRPIS